MMRSARKLLPIFLWLLVALVFASQLYLFSARAGGQMGWRDALVWEIPRWCLWAPFVPLVTKLLRKHPFGKHHAFRPIALHTLYGALLSLLHLILFVLVFHVLRLMLGNQGSVVDTLLFAFPLDFHVGIAVYWLMLLLRQTRDSEQRLAKLQVELSRAQLQALKMQLHPHFLFNTLNSISSFLRTDVETADEMIGRLGDFLRLTLQNPGTEEIALEKELEFLKRYLEIEQLRFQDRLHTEFEIDPGTLAALVPNLILQPVVENAVRHGISSLARAGEIRIAVRQHDGQLRISICDNGPGLPNQIKEGIGITATRDRLRNMYGAGGRLDMANRPHGGAVVTLEIPYRVQEKTT